MFSRPYDPERDLEAVRRIWRETGWLEGDSVKAMDIALTGATTARVADLNDEAECLVLTCDGSLRHLDDDLPFCCVTGVTTSRVARRQGLAGRCTAESIAAGVESGAIVAGLGMFEQGFYDRLGFGSGSYQFRIIFDPTMLQVPPARRAPVRLTEEQVADVHANRLGRRRFHGGANLHPTEFTRAEFEWIKNGFGLGYRDGENGALSHHMWFGVRGDVEHGPYSVIWTAYETSEQLLELLGLLKNLGDQVYTVRMLEPPGLQLQDLIDRPISRRTVTEGSDHATKFEALTDWQMRLCDVPAALERTHLRTGESLRFNLELTDPIERYLDAEAPWRGVGGQYVVTLGSESDAAPGTDSTLPTMKASVNAFTRLWLGVRAASVLAVTDDIDAPAELLADLDRVLHLPVPHPDWQF